MQVEKTKVRFAKLIRLIKDVEIVLPADFERWSEEEQQEILSELYEEQSDLGWEIDYEWGEDEGTHEIFSKKENQDEDQDEDQEDE